MKEEAPLLGHHHNHSHSVQATGWVLRISVIATLAFTAVEVYAGLHSKSLALISDAGHNFTDALALVLAAVGLYLQERPGNESKTFGYHRAGVIAAFLNAITLLLLSGGIFWEASSRLLHPQPVEDRVMLWVAAAALVLNGAIVIALNSGNKNDINIRAAVVHMVGDAVGAVTIIVAAIVIHYTGFSYIDPLLSMALGVLILYTAWDIVKESLNILLEGTPRGIDVQLVTDELSLVDGVLHVHDLHIWSLGSNTHALSSHVLIEDMPPSASQGMLKRINDVLCKFGIHHTTIQFEHVPCILSQAGCGGKTHDHALAEHDHSGHDHAGHKHRH